MENAYYIAFILFCYTSLGIILLKTIFGSLYRRKKTYIIVIILSSLTFITPDLIWMMVDEKNAFVGVKYFLNILYFIGVLIVTNVFFWYSEIIQDSKIFKNKSTICLAFIPAIIVIILLLTTPLTKLVFYFNEDNEYHRGFLYPLLIVLIFFYPFISLIKSLYNIQKKENFSKRSEFLSLYKFILFPIIGFILQFFLPYVPYCSIGIVLGILWLYLDSVDTVNYIDALTDIYNKKALTKQLQHDLSQLNSNSQYYLIMLDVDKFKGINDTYGHAEGDLALMIIAKVLREYCRLNYGYVARYGGDEFTILVNLRAHQTIFSFCMGLEETIKNANIEYRRPYEIKISYGYAKFDESMKYIPDFISAADKKLYENKNSK